MNESNSGGFLNALNASGGCGGFAQGITGGGLGYGGHDYFMGTYLCTCSKCEHIWERGFYAASNSLYPCPHCDHVAQHEHYRIKD